MNNLELLNNIKKLCEQMKTDDIEDNPDSAYEQFQCECCGEVKMLAGSLLYNDYRLCNECVFLAEIGFATNKYAHIQELLDDMEEKRFTTVYESLFNIDENSLN